MKWQGNKRLVIVGVFVSIWLLLLLTPLVDKVVDPAALSGLFALLGAALAYVFAKEGDDG